MRLDRNIIFYKSNHPGMDSSPQHKGLLQTNPRDLTIGMYVAELDRDWSETNFPIQGFYIRNRKTIERIEATCAYVFVDPRRYDSKLGSVKLHAVPDSGPKEHAEPAKPTAKERLAPVKPHVYEDSVEVKEEVAVASASLADAESILQDCVIKLQETGGFDINAIETAITPLVQSVMRNQTALAALTRMRHLDNYTFSHAIACAVWAAVLGREIGLPPDDINEIAFACSIMDLGKTALPVELLTSPDQPSPEQWKKLRGHVMEGSRLLQENGVTDPRILAVVETHHERHDGSGYPNGLSGNQIPPFGRIAGIVDSYDAMISERPYAQARPSYHAIQEIQSNADKLFQQELVDYFVRAIGVFRWGRS